MVLTHLRRRASKARQIPAKWVKKWIIDLKQIDFWLSIGIVYWSHCKKNWCKILILKLNITKNWYFIKVWTVGGKSQKFSIICCNFINDRYCVSVIWHSSKVHLFSTNSFTLSHIDSFIYANFYDSNPNQKKTFFHLYHSIKISYVSFIIS